MAYKVLLWPSEDTRLEWDKLRKRGIFDSKCFGEFITDIQRYHQIKTVRLPWRGSREAIKAELSSHIEVDALKFVLGQYTDELKYLIQLFHEKTKSEKCFPLSPLVSPSATGAGTPVSDTTGRCISYPFNVTPEWIRQALNAWHNIKKHQEMLGHKYFPFKYRDHLIHPVTVWLVGHLLLQNYCIPPAVLATLCEIVAKDPKLHGIEQDLAKVFPLCEVIAMIWRKKAASNGNKLCEMTSDDVLLAWQDVALWHDAGYDSLFWCLTNAVEFSHCRIYDPSEVTARIVKCCKTLLTRLPLKDIPLKLRKKLEQVTDLLKDIDLLKATDPYHLVWEIDEWKNEDPSSRPWGRSHAVLSAYEFLEHHDEKKRRCYHLDMPSLAIAEHHERLHQHQEDDKFKLAAEFVRSPFSSLLRWADSLAVFPRVTLDWINASKDKKESYQRLEAKFNYDDHISVQIQNEQLICTIKEKKDDKNEEDKIGKITTYFLWGTVIK